MNGLKTGADAVASPMSETPPTPPASGSSAAVPLMAAGAESAAKFFAALGNPLRWVMVKLITQRGPQTATDLATALKRDFDGVSKHLRVLSRGGVVQAMRGDDRRQIYFYIPKANQQEPGVLDYGKVRLDLRDPAPAEPVLSVRL
ncbi:MAG: winged helix-turn-helix transcriptional regulator [Verrucomicrobiales bacterium]|nr:winged helix-turn-helix transcriptional regulator [Verrucomicrobiales bacterium]